MTQRYRRIQQRQRRNTASMDIPVWSKLQKLSIDEIKAMAARLGIAWDSRMKTLSAINKAR